MLSTGGPGLLGVCAACSRHWQAHHWLCLDCKAQAVMLTDTAAQGRAAEAISCYEHVALLQPESPEAHANLASAYKDAARQDTAIQRYQQVRTCRCPVQG